MFNTSSIRKKVYVYQNGRTYIYPRGQDTYDKRYDIIPLLDVSDQKCDKSVISAYMMNIIYYAHTYFTDSLAICLSPCIDRYTDMLLNAFLSHTWVVSLNVFVVIIKTLCIFICENIYLLTIIIRVLGQCTYYSPISFYSNRNIE